MQTLPRTRLWASIATVALLGACDGAGGGQDGDDDGSDESLFTAAELGVLKTKFAVLPSAPPPEPSNAVADAPDAVALGHKLYHEARYSENGQVSCATCHNPTTGFQDDRNNTALGLDFTGRHTPTVLNAAFLVDSESTTNWMFWDGRKDSMWSQAMGPPESAVEMGGNRVRIAYMLFDHYRAEYEAIFGPMPELRSEDGTQARYPVNGMPGTPDWDGLSTDEQDMFNRIYSNFGKAISAFERKIFRGNSKFDQFYTQAVASGSGVSTALTPCSAQAATTLAGSTKSARRRPC